MTMRQRAFLPLLLGVLGCLSSACSESAEDGAAPAVLAAPLIGTWTATFELPDDASQSLRELKPDADDLLRRELRRTASKPEMTIRITYRADRTGTIQRLTAGESWADSFSWSLLSATPQQIKIEQEMDNAASLDRITYNIDSPDRLTHADGVMKGQSMVRVK